MTGSIYRYWMLPSRCRRWRPRTRLGLAAVLIGLSLCGAAYPLGVWLPQHAWENWDGLWAALIYEGFLFFLSLFLALAGATTIAPERERGTWDALMVTPLGCCKVVRAVLICRTARCACMVMFTIPFWLAWGYEVLAVNHVGPMTPGDTPEAPSHVAACTGLFLAWIALRTVGHALPFVALGVAISAFNRRTRTALAVTCAALLGYGLLAWCLVRTAFFWLIDTQQELASRILLWPLMPNDWAHYSARSLLSDRWMEDLLADLVWMFALPALLYRFAVWGCRRRG